MVALACLSTTLLLAKDAIRNLTEQARVELLLKAASRLGIDDMCEDEDFLVCPAQKDQKTLFVRAMQYVTCLVYELQEFAEEGGQGEEEEECDK